MSRQATAITTRSGRFWLSSLASLAVLVWASLGSLRDLPRVVRGFPFLLDYVGGMFPPDFSRLPFLWKPLVETVQTAIVGVGAATVLALPLSFLVAKNTSPSGPLYFLGRCLVAFLRGLPTLLWAILWVSMVGLGPLAGVFAIVCHCVGTFGKLFSEAIEATGPKIKEVMEAMRLDGAEEMQVIRYGLFPEVFPLLASYVVYYFEWAIRVGAILGLVGAGGIGLELTMAIRSFRRQESAAILLMILVLVILIDQMSRKIRTKLLEDW